MTATMPEARLRWLCRRGMKELDVLLEGYLDTRYMNLDERGREAFMRLMMLEDPDLHAILMGRQAAPDPECADVIEQLRQYKSSH